MSEAKHTPGPWRQDFDDKCPLDIIAPDGECLASAYPMEYWGCEQGEAIGRANACLIAAAPDLLAFVKAQFASTACICGFKAAGYTDMPCTRCDAEKLIAKAEGR